MTPSEVLAFAKENGAVAADISFTVMSFLGIFLGEENFYISLWYYHICTYP